MISYILLRLLIVRDTAGQERYRSLTRNHFRNAQVDTYFHNNCNNMRNVPIKCLRYYPSCPLWYIETHRDRNEKCPYLKFLTLLTHTHSILKVYNMYDVQTICLHLNTNVLDAAVPECPDFPPFVTVS
jgi:hypothetical protein